MYVESFSHQHKTSTPTRAAQSKLANISLKNTKSQEQKLLKFKYFLRPFGHFELADKFGKAISKGIIYSVMGDLSKLLLFCGEFSQCEKKSALDTIFSYSIK